jgi:hypothetical protein
MDDCDFVNSVGWCTMLVKVNLFDSVYPFFGTGFYLSGLVWDAYRCFACRVFSW